jgi:hypothetical protein
LPSFYGGDVAVRLCVAPALRRAFALRHRALERWAADFVSSRSPAQVASGTKSWK